MDQTVAQLSYASMLGWVNTNYTLMSFHSTHHQARNGALTLIDGLSDTFMPTGRLIQ